MAELVRDGKAGAPPATAVVRQDAPGAADGVREQHSLEAVEAADLDVGDVQDARDLFDRHRRVDRTDLLVDCSGDCHRRSEVAEVDAGQGHPSGSSGDAVLHRGDHRLDHRPIAG